MSAGFPILSVLRDTRSLPTLSVKDWELLIRQARAANLLAFLYHVVVDNDLENDIPVKAMLHLESVHIIALKQREAVMGEIEVLKSILNQVDAPLILLKGAAYIKADLRASKGRLMSDIDILVPQSLIGAAEKRLALNGWLGAQSDSYNQRYYRKWMHEIPPLTHVQRQTALDVHHTILPPTAKFKPDPEKLLSDIREVNSSGVFTLSPIDMVVHSATHLFHEGEFHNGLRDLVDMASLCAEFGDTEPLFWEQLVPRAKELDLIRPLFYFLRYSQKLIHAQIPNHCQQAVGSDTPSRLKLFLMDVLFTRALLPEHESCKIRFSDLARWFLYVRSHYLKMPLYLLIPHLIRKAWMSKFGDSPKAEQREAHTADDIHRAPQA